MTNVECRMKPEGRSPKVMVAGASLGFEFWNFIRHSSFVIRHFLLLFAFIAPLRAAPSPTILTVEGTNAWVQRFSSNVWESAYAQQLLRAKDRGRTDARSLMTVRLSDLSVLRIGAGCQFEIEPLPEPGIEAEFSLFKGLLYLLHRDQPGAHRFKTPTATAATRGTEFVLEVEDATGRTTLTVLEGEAELRNAVGSLRLATGEQGVAVLGQAPTKTAVIDTTNVVQWCLYYPGVLDLDELELTPAEQAALADSLTAYRGGDLLQAVAAYPAARTPASDRERVYLAALLLAVGEIAQAEALLDALTEPAGSRSDRLAKAIRLVIGSVKRRNSPAADTPSLATELLATSYEQQARLDLSAARISARRAVELSPRFGFAWTRLAELEFSHGDIRAAQGALERSLTLAPRNAQAVALQGFLFSAQNKMGEARASFDQAIALDGRLGNAWLGRGLSLIRQGHAEEGRFALQVAATSEPQRSLLRSYLGKAFSNAGDTRRAEKELRLASEIDAGDPTPWLYSALLLQQENRINEGVRALEQSQELNDNRAVYRSRLLLDQDRAVRGANLANLYRDAGMTDVGVREAGRAVNADYANYSAHLFLANSFNELRDPKQVSLRYETAWFTEYLIGNLLAPIGGGELSQAVSQQEYSKLFERDRLGLSSSTEYASHGEWIQSAAQYGTFGNSSYAVETFYHTDQGQRPNNDLEQFATVVNFKQQLTPSDSLYLRTSFYDAETGDVNQYYDQSQANPGLRTRESQQPVVLAGWHHEWGPGSHTLFLAGRLQDTLEVDNPYQRTLFLNRGFGGPVVAVSPLNYDQHYESELQIYTGELQQIWQRGAHTAVVGGRFQGGNFQTENDGQNGVVINGTNGLPLSYQLHQNDTSGFDRESLYAYDHWQICAPLLLAAGVSYDRVHFPANYRYAPISNGEETRDQVSPKVGLILKPAPNTTVRAAWFRALGGVSLDQSYRLEPSQVAGFNQAFRSIIPESVAGANAAPKLEVGALSLEQKLGRGTYLGLAGELLESEVRREVGVVEFAIPSTAGSPFSTSTTPERLRFRESSLTFTLNQLLSDEWTLAASYRVSRAELDETFTAIPTTVADTSDFQRHQDLAATLQQLRLAVIYNHRSGFFSSLGTIWSAQENGGYSTPLPGDAFWQINLEAGWRFARRRAEIRVGLLNLTDRDYHLNPLNLTAELPRERTFVARFRFNF